MSLLCPLKNEMTFYLSKKMRWLLKWLFDQKINNDQSQAQMVILEVISFLEGGMQEELLTLLISESLFIGFIAIIVLFLFIKSIFYDIWTYMNSLLGFFEG